MVPLPAFQLPVLEHHHIIPKSELQTWIGLKRRGWLPEETKEHPEHEPRDDLLMCKNHHSGFDECHFFIRFLPDVRKFVFTNYSCDEDFQEFYGKAIALGNRDRYVPFPSLFIIHEMRVRGRHRFQPSDIDLPDDILWQQWISASGVYNNVSDSFSRRTPPGSRSDDVSARPLPEAWTATIGTGVTPPGRRRITLNADVIDEILAATRASPSWKACKMEGTSWDGTAEENIQKYGSSVGVQDSQDSEPEDPIED
ncbi:hypothetical protein ACEPAI_3898 [Sanghuangporus weigelae]